MPWLRLEASALTHPKLISVKGAGILLYLRSISYAANHLTDGVVPRDAVPGLVADFVDLEVWPYPCPRTVRPLSGRNGVTSSVTPLREEDEEDEERRVRDALSKRRRRLVARLVEVGLWHETSDGYVVHDYLDYQPSAKDAKDAKDRAREANRERQRRYRARKKGGTLSASRPEQDDVTPTTIRSNSLKRVTRNAVTPTSPSGGPSAALRDEPEVEIDYVDDPAGRASEVVRMLTDRLDIGNAGV